MLKSLCVIPARSGSKGLKDKNILDLSGKPVLAYTIEACKNAGIFSEVFVATDSEVYAEIAQKYGALVPFLEPEEMAGDLVSSAEPLLYFYEQLKKEYDLLWCFQPTSPLKTAEDIINAYKVLEENPECQYVLSTTIIDPHYFHWALEERENGMTELYFGKKMLVDRSLLNPVYRPNGAIKVGRTEKVLEYRHFFGDHIMRTEMPEERAIHIRSQFDLDLCRMLVSGEDKKCL
ncbi:acylneuraminate cytidylyltransferase family protein [Anaeromicropila populeti]|uniref:CMP-N,N'-diacetyllegionaminic acid synthase n=1 Tax=Anaeromicropila populeti TaxID=37658 RepID=A0A1I6HW54_9FIRM|nr:acylneuraminate cytidylyltransferase family protein [Anaeromicropila populeti]SFR58681.1 CMP-N,N'-diacetyllegionaminic acid synthase [Anaeromicropila populeti]